MRLGTNSLLRAALFPCTTSLSERSSLRALSTIRTRVKAHNSLSRENEDISYDGRSLSWYTCGPTVYDDAHVGHGRTYVAIDTMVRVMRRVFNVPVHHVMGITDVDDKILARAQENGVVCSHFATWARKYEERFLEDMSMLGVEPPNRVVRVSEYIDSIEQFIGKIENSGYAYKAGDGSTLFDVGRYEENFHYRPLSRRKGQVSANVDTPVVEDVGEEGDGDTQHHVRQKRNAADFALWKSDIDTADAGGRWDSSALGRGRPGWHIECSAMTWSVFGEKLDVHCGGQDLKFPHHDNEIAQCNAAFGHENPQWPRYFLHTGHVRVSGRKMSKSLKNFQTLREIFESYSPAAFRMFTLLHKYNSNVEYGVDRMKDAEAVVNKFAQFLGNVNYFVGKVDKHAPKRWNNDAERLNAEVQAEQVKYMDALSNDFDTPAAVAALLNVATLVNSAAHSQSQKMPLELVFHAADWVRNQLCTLGLECMGGLLRSSPYVVTPTVSNLDGETMPSASSVLDVLVQSRWRTRRLARSLMKNDADAKRVARAILEECDYLRDVSLHEMRVEVKDHQDGSDWSIR